MQLRYIVLLALSLQNSLYTLLRRYSNGILKETYTSASVLGMAEVIKFVVAFAMFDDLMPAASPIRWARGKALLLDSRPMVVPALVYLFMNMLSFVAITRVDATVFSMVAQLKVLTTAVCSVVVLGRRFAKLQWLAISVLSLAVMIITRQRGGASAHVDGQSTSTTAGSNFSTSFVVGVAAVGLEVFLSGWISTYMEKYLKDGTYSLWARNLQVAFWSMGLYFPMHFVQYSMSVVDGPTSSVVDGSTGAMSNVGVAAILSIFSGWSMITVLVVLLGAGGGLLVTSATKYADAVAKTVAVSLAIVIVIVLEVVLLRQPMDPVVGMAAMIALVAMETYREAGVQASVVVAFSASRTNEEVQRCKSEGHCSEMACLTGDEISAPIGKRRAEPTFGSMPP